MIVRKIRNPAVYKLESELEDNKKRIKFLMDRNENDAELRKLLIQRSNLKDMLLDEYRKLVGG